jgi:hypothetical protein
LPCRENERVFEEKAGYQAWKKHVKIEKQEASGVFQVLEIMIIVIVYSNRVIS